MKTAFGQADRTLFANEHEPLLTPEQRKIYHTIVSAVRDKHGRSFMIDAPVGTGKNVYGESNCRTSKGVGYSCVGRRVHRDSSPPTTRRVDCPLYGLRRHMIIASYPGADIPPASNTFAYPEINADARLSNTRGILSTTKPLH